MKASGKFEVKLGQLELSIKGADGITLGRNSIEKNFTGELTAASVGEMLSAMTPETGSAGYVAVEQVTGTLSGRIGSFVLQHFGMMGQGSNILLLQVVPDSGTGALKGISGKLNIKIEEGQHFYEFEYELPKE